MAFLAASDVFEVVIEGTINGENYALVQHYRVNILGDPVITAFEGAVNIGGLVKTAYIALVTTLSDQLSFNLIRANRIHPAIDVPFVELINPVDVGAVEGDSLPGKDAMVVKLQTILPGKSGRGRKYITGLAESQHVNGVLTDAFIGSVQDELDALYLDGFTDGDDNEWEPAVWSRKLQVATHVNRVTIDPVVRSMGTRQPRFANPS